MVCPQVDCYDNLQLILSMSQDWCLLENPQSALLFDMLLEDLQWKDILSIVFVFTAYLI